MTRIGYVRVSSKNQNLQRQIEKMHEHKVTKIFEDKLSGKNAKRPGLNDLLDYIREDDIVVVTELDRLGRNNQDLTKIINHINTKGATLEVLNLPSMTGIQDKNLRLLINNLILEIYKYQAESERKAIKERQETGIKLAKEQGKYKGRKPLFNEDSPQLKQAFKLYEEESSIKQAAEATGINRETLRRYLKKYNLH